MNRRWLDERTGPSFEPERQHHQTFFFLLLVSVHHTETSVKVSATLQERVGTSGFQNKTGALNVGY